MSSTSQTISRVVIFSTQTIKALVFAFISLFFLVGGIFNSIVMYAYISVQNEAHDWEYFIGFSLLYLVLGILSIYKTIKTIKQLKKVATNPAPQISLHQGLLRIICNWPVIILLGAFTLFIAYIGISMLYVVAFQNPYFFQHGLESYISYFVLFQVTCAVILGLVFITVMMIMQRLKSLKK